MFSQYTSRAVQQQFVAAGRRNLLSRHSIILSQGQSRVNTIEGLPRATQAKMMFAPSTIRRFSNENKPEKDDQDAKEEVKEEAKEEGKQEENKSEQPPPFEKKKVNVAAQVLIGLGLFACALFPVFSQGAKEPEKTHMIEEVRKEHSNERFELPAGMKLVEIDFASDLQEGDMRGLQVGESKDQKVLVARYQGQLYATGSSCSHFGVDLSFGMLFDDKVLCPAHAAGFSIVTGKPELAPGLDGIPSYLVIHKDGKWFVQVPQDGLPKTATMPLTKRDPSNEKHFVIVGGGPAGLNCAETLRQSGFSGQVTVITAEDMVPYDRTLLSKALPMIDARKKPLRPAEFLTGADIDYKLSSTVAGINKTAKMITLASGEVLSYDKLCIATGSKVRKPNVPGANLNGVHYLRTSADQEGIKEGAANARSIAIIGSSWIATEVASSLIGKYKGQKDIHLIQSTEFPLERALGKDIGAMLAKEHEQAGVKIIANENLSACLGDSQGRTTGVKLTSGRVIEADLVIIGKGVTPATEFLSSSGINMQSDGSLTCNPFMQTSDKDIFAAGDIASYPSWVSGKRTRTEHWNVALDQGTFAAFNMLGKLIPYGNVPFFWTRNYNKSIQYCGNGADATSTFIQGDVMANKFVAFFVNDEDKVVAVAAQGQGQALLTLMEAMQQNLMPRASAIKGGHETVESIKGRLKQNVGGGKCKRANCCQKKSRVD